MATTTTTTWGSSTTYYDAEGNVVDEEVEGGHSETTTTSEYASISDIPAASIVEVVNQKGTELPSTGGIGTTIFYVIGAILVLGAGILLVTRRRMNAN
jgi:LPXTG-motif cell wall-anchored protein